MNYFYIKPGQILNLHISAYKQKMWRIETDFLVKLKQI